MVVRYPRDEEIKKILKMDDDFNFAGLDEDKYYLAAFDGDKILGFAPVVLKDDTLFILGTNLTAKARGKSEVQIALGEACLKEARSLDVNYIDFIYEGNPSEEMENELRKSGFSDMQQVTIDGQTVCLHCMYIKEQDQDEGALFTLTKILGDQYLKETLKQDLK